MDISAKIRHVARGPGQLISESPECQNRGEAKGRTLLQLEDGKARIDA
jgi:hypothetical protein